MKAWQAVILAGGRGRRLWPLTALYPKSLTRVYGIPVILYAIAMLKRAGAREILLTVPHRTGDTFRRRLGNGERIGIRLKYVFEPIPMGTGGALRWLQPLLHGQLFVLVNSDTMLDLDVGELLVWYEKVKPAATMVVRPKPASSHFSPVVVNSEARIVTIRDSPPTTHQGGMAIRMFAGVQVLTEAIFDYLPEGHSDIVSAFWQPALVDSLDLRAYDYAGPWWEVGTLRQLLKAVRESRPADFPALRYIFSLLT